jgi:hypothetical protein
MYMDSRSNCHVLRKQFYEFQAGSFFSVNSSVLGLKQHTKIIIQNLKIICYKIEAFQTLSDHECNQLTRHLHLIPGHLSTSRPRFMPICFTPFCFNAPYQYILLYPARSQWRTYHECCSRRDRAPSSVKMGNWAGRTHSQ